MQTAETTTQFETELRPAPLPLRDNTMLGICEAIGEDFGFHANWLRLALACGILVNATAVVGIYLGLGVIVAISRLVFPKAKRVAAKGEPAVVQAQPQQVEERERELIAA
jgi:phage shock protein C